MFTHTGATRVTITPKAEATLRGGHVWVYENEVTAIAGDFENGDLVDVYSSKNAYLGTGFLNGHSKIRVRLLSRNTNDRYDEDFWERRLRYALDYRRSVMPKEDFQACRLLFGDADGFPGLTVDRFGPVLVAEVLSLGIEKVKATIFSLLLKLLRQMGETITVLYERSDSGIRALEGMDAFVGFHQGEGLTTTNGRVDITENGIRYHVDYVNGQKTGFFLDQKYNRAAVGRISRGRRVLDCFTHTGAFALNAAAGGAEHVTAVDVSQDALTMAAENAKENQLSEKISFLCEDVFALLSGMALMKRRDYDFIILDPPAFTKSRDTIKSAIKGYREINRRAMQLLPRGGYLATCSCSHFMTNTLFLQMLHNAAQDANVSLRQIEGRQQSPDHPILWNVPETDYLKFYLFQIV